MLLQIAIGQCAKVFATYLDQKQITPDALEVSITQNEPVIVNAIQQVAGSGLASVRSMFGAVADRFSAQQTGPNGSWHPYLAVLQQPVLAVQHRLHVEAILRHQGWYKTQMDAAVQFLRGR